VFGLLLPLTAFYVFVSIFSHGAESDARWRILAIALVATLLLAAITSQNRSLLGLAVACFVAAVVSLVGLIFWIKVTRSQALKITGSYIGFVVGYSVVVDLIFGPRAA
jgi:hypothetical protein